MNEPRAVTKAPFVVAFAPMILKPLPPLLSRCGSCVKSLDHLQSNESAWRIGAHIAAHIAANEQAQCLRVLASATRQCCASQQGEERQTVCVGAPECVSCLTNEVVSGRRTKNNVWSQNADKAMANLSLLLAAGFWLTRRRSHADNSCY